MSKQLTKSELIAQLEAAHVSYELLSTERDALRTEVSELRAKAVALGHGGAQHHPETRLCSQSAHDAYVLALIRAKEMAVKTGRSVRVG